MEHREKCFGLRKRLGVAIMICFAATCHGQANDASVTGLVTDTSGAVVTGATITFTNTDTGIVTEAVANSQGLYRIAGLIPGHYRANVTHSGFKAEVKEGIELHVADQLAINFSLSVGQVSETVTVQAGDQLLDTQSTSLGETIEAEEVQQAPLNGRNAMNLVGLVPGVVPQGRSQGYSGAADSVGRGNYQVGGGVAGWNAVFIDGANVNASLQNQEALVPTQDSVSEFHVDTNAVPAQYGRFGGGVISFSTKSGTNAFHGSAYEYLRNTAFDANTFFNDRFGQPKAVLHQNQFGATLGGPIIRNRAFFFASWEQVRLLTSGSTEYRSPTPAEMSGDFRADGPTFDIKTFSRANCNGVLDTFCPNELDLTAAAMYNHSPSYFAPIETNPAKLAVLEASGYNGAIVAKSPENSIQLVGRLDYQLTPKQRLFTRYSYWDTLNGSPSVAASPAVPLPAIHQNTVQAVVGDDYTFSPTLTGSLRLAYFRFLQDVPPISGGKFDFSYLGPNWAQIGSLLSFREPPTFFPGISWFGQPFQLAFQEFDNHDNYSLSANFTKVHGRHSIQFGGEARRVEFYLAESIFPGGNFATVGIGSPAGASGGVDSGIGNFVEGVTISIPGLTEINPVIAPQAYHYYQGYYAMDTWQVTPKLTANVGLRWELPGAWLEKHDLDTVLLADRVNPIGTIANPAGGPSQLKGTIALVNSQQYRSRAQSQIHLDLFEPRVGLNYSINSQTLVRVGFGIAHPCIDCGSSSIEPSTSPINSAVTLTQAPFGSLSNPFPNGISLPTGRSPDLMAPYLKFAQTLIGGSVTGQEPYQTFPYIMQWNASVERSLGSKSAITLSYEASRGRHLGNYDVNLDQLPDRYQQQAAQNPAFAAQLLSQVANPLYGIATPTGRVGGPTANYGQFLLPYPEFTSFNSAGKYYGGASYNALIATYRKNFASGSLINVAYTWAHLITNNDSQNGFAEPGEGQIGFGPQDYYNPRADYSDSSDDVRHRFTAEYILALPVGRGRKYLGSANGILDQIVGGWLLSGITTLQSGLPIGLTTAAGDEMSSVFGAGAIRPNIVPGVSKRASGSRFERTLPGNTWFNTAAFVAPPTTSFTFGNESRLDSTLRQDGLANWDMGLSKSFRVDQRIGFQFRAEYFNVFNRPQFNLGSSNGQIGAASGVGQITSTSNQSRVGQFSVRLNY